MKDSIRYVSVQEYAAYFNLKPRAVHEACRKGRIPGAVQPMGYHTEWRIPVKERVCA